KGKVDHLVGLKENVIIGKLIPAGTGMECYRNVEVDKTNPVEFDLSEYEIPEEDDSIEALSKKMFAEGDDDDFDRDGEDLSGDDDLDDYIDDVDESESDYDDEDEFEEEEEDFPGDVDFPGEDAGE
ncbi:MAG: hypothetical protein II736_02985, partial [Clostridia bacterium]|nr:hypothetical protein [Clostridia bacterium]